MAANGMGSSGTSTPIKSTSLICSGHTRPVTNLHFSGLLAPSSPVSPLAPTGGSPSSTPNYLLISGCKDGKPMLRDWLGDWMGTFLGHKGAVWCARLSADGAYGCTASADFSSRFWDASTGETLAVLPHKHIVRTADLSASSKHILTGGAEKKLRRWDVTRAPTLAEGQSAETEWEDGVDEFKSGDEPAHKAAIKSAVWHEEGQSVVSMDEKEVKFFDIRTLQPTHSLSFAAPIVTMEKSVDGTLLSITSGKEVTFLSLASRLPYITHQLNYAPSAASLHPINGKTFVTGSTTDGWVRVHDATTGAEKEVGKGHHGPIHCVSYSPDGELYATGSEDGTVRLWQTSPKNYGLWRAN